MKLTDRIRCLSVFGSVIALIAVGALPGQALADTPHKPAPNALSPDVSKLVSRAQDAEKRGDLRIATILLKNAAQAAPHNAAVREALGTILVVQGQMVQGERILRQARSLGAPDSAVLPGLFQAMLSQHKGQAVLDQFPEPAGRSKVDIDTLRARALAYFSLNQPTAADAEIDKALSAGRTAPLLINKAEFAIARGDRLLARNLTDEALKSSPNNRTALIMKVGLLERQGAYTDALVYANKLVRSSKDDTLPLVLRIELLANMGRNDAAQADVNALLKIAPNMPIALYDKALLLARKGNIKEAWHIAQGLPPDFLHSAPQFGIGYANIAKASGNEELSDATLTAVISTFPENEEARRELAEKRNTQKNYKAALAILQPIANSPDWKVMAALGNTYKGLGQDHEAEDYFARASAAKADMAVGTTSAATVQSVDHLRNLVAKDPGNPDTTGTLIVVLIGQDHLQEARAVADRFDKAAPHTRMSPYFRGQIAMASGDLDTAAADFTSALHIAPAFAPALFYRAQVDAARGDMAAANTDLDALLRSDPKNIQALLKKAQFSAQAGNVSTTLNLLQRAVAAAPDRPEPQIALAEFYFGQQMYTDALKIATAAEHRFPNNLGVTSILVNAQLAVNAVDSAKTSATKLSRANPESAPAQLLLAHVLGRTGDQKGALTAYKAAIHAAPKEPDGYDALASYYLQIGHKDEAVATARNLVKQIPDSASDLILAGTLLKSGNTTEAGKVLEKSVAARPNSRVLLALVAIQMQTDRKGATERLARWAAAHDTDVDAHIQLANILLVDGDFAGARSQLERAIHYQPYNASALNDMAWAMQKSDPAQAIGFATKAVKLSPRSGEILDTLAWLNWQQNNRDQSLSQLRKAHALSPGDPNIAYHLAVVLNDFGDRASARNVLQVALKPGSHLLNRAEAQQLQARLK
jgi:putative PEP-CTERM system TPR-repeat lipoprotein